MSSRYSTFYIKPRLYKLNLYECHGARLRGAINPVWGCRLGIFTWYGSTPKIAYDTAISSYEILLRKGYI